MFVRVSLRFNWTLKKHTKVMSSFRLETMLWKSSCPTLPTRSQNWSTSMASSKLTEQNRKLIQAHHPEMTLVGIYWKCVWNHVQLVGLHTLKFYFSTSFLMSNVKKPIENHQKIVVHLLKKNAKVVTAIVMNTPGDVVKAEFGPPQGCGTATANCRYCMMLCSCLPGCTKLLAPS